MRRVSETPTYVEAESSHNVQIHTGSLFVAVLIMGPFASFLPKRNFTNDGYNSPIKGTLAPIEDESKVIPHFKK